MPLIRASNMTQSPTPFSLKDIEAQAQAILLRAQQQAEQLLAQAQEEAARLKAEAQAQGLREGHEQGLARGRQEGLKAGRDQALADHAAALTSAIAALDSAAGAIERARLELQTDAVEQVLKLAIAIARRATKRLGRLDHTVAAANVAEALKFAVHAADVRVAIHPADKAALEAALPELRLKLPQLEHISIVEDASVEPGGCRLFTGSGSIDATLDTQLDRIVADLVPDAAEDRHEPL